MTLLELSTQYRTHATTLRERIALLVRLEAKDEVERRLLETRVRILRTMWRETRDLAVLTERYYERGYCRNAKYTL